MSSEETEIVNTGPNAAQDSTNNLKTELQICIRTSSMNSYLNIETKAVEATEAKVCYRNWG